MTDPEERMRERELERRRENELKDLVTERDHSERPLEGFSSADTTWTRDTDERQAGVHSHDEERSLERSRAQVPPEPPHHEE